MRISFKKRTSLTALVSSTVFSLLSNAAESTNNTAALFDAIRMKDVQAVEQAITRVWMLMQETNMA
jgi:hypothetical protein